MDKWEEIKFRLVKEGRSDRVKFLEGLNKIIPPSAVLKIRQNDKSVLQEIVLPSWLDWDTLFVWAQRQSVVKGMLCIFCAQASDVGVNFKEKWICEQCFLKLKEI
ncbi:MAG: hypothetical protein QXZ13_02845 [Candidatus Diapherotrites archaeon]